MPKCNLSSTIFKLNAQKKAWANTQIFIPSLFLINNQFSLR